MHLPEEHPHVISRNARYGLLLFTVYVALYGGFIFLAVFRTALLSVDVFGGVNLAVAYGMTLIAAALILALVYARLCRQPTQAGQEMEEAG